MAAKETDCIKRDVCIFHKSGSTSDLCEDCGHYISEAQNTSTNSARGEIPHSCINCYHNKDDSCFGHVEQWCKLWSGTSPVA